MWILFSIKCIKKSNVEWKTQASNKRLRGTTGHILNRTRYSFGK